MGELIAILLGTGVLVTLLVGVVTILRWLVKLFVYFASEASSDARVRHECPVCSASVGAEHICDRCGWKRSEVGLLAPRRIAASQLRKLRQRGLIPEETLRELIRHLEDVRVAATSPRQPQGPIVAAQQVSASAPAPTAPPTSRHVAPPSTAAKSDDMAAPVTRSTAPSTPPVAAVTPPPPVVPPQVPQGAAPEPAPTAERVRRFVSSQDQLAATARTAAPAPPSLPRRALGEVLAAFMEEKHIRWGELVGGLLIVSSSAALVISFWSTIAERPFLKFGVFNGVTAVLFGIGLFAARRWKLPTTSQGVLIIATLLVPLNFLAIAAFSEGAESNRLLAVGGEVLSVGVFSVFVTLAAHVLLPHAVVPLSVVVIGQSIVQLIIRRTVAPDVHLGLLYAISTVSLLGYAAANVWGSHRLQRKRPWSARRANEGLKLLGISTFATLMPAGLLIFKTDSLQLVRQLSPLTPILAIPALALGISLWRGVQEKLTGLQTAGASIAVCGVLVLMTGLALAWPQPQTLLPAALMSCAMLTFVALWFGIPESQLPAAGCFGVAYVLAFLLAVGEITWHLSESKPLIDAALSASTGNALAGLVGLFGGMAGIYAVLNRQRDAFFVGVAAAGAGAASLGLVLCYGFARSGDPHGATWMLALYTVASLVAVVLTRHLAAAWCCTVLSLLTCIQGIVFRWAESLTLTDPWSVALLTDATLMALLSVIGASLYPRLLPTVTTASPSPSPHKGALWQTPAPWQLQASCWSTACLAVTVAALVWIPVRAGLLSAPISAMVVSWLGLLWLVLAWLHREALLFAAFQASITVALVIAVDQRLRTADWYSTVQLGWTHPWAVQVQGIALGLLSVVWTATRWGLVWSGVTSVGSAEQHWQVTTERLLLSPRYSVDRIVAAALVVVLALLAVYAVIPGVGQELSPQTTVALQGVERLVPEVSQFEWWDIPHDAALGLRAWLFWATVLALLAIGLAVHCNLWRALGLAMTFSAACLLLAGRWETQVSVASALRWYTAGLFGLGSIGIFLRRPLATAVRRLMPSSAVVASTGSRGRQSSYHGMVLLLFVTVTPLVAMALFVSFAAMRVSPPTGEQIEALNWLLAMFAICGLVGVVVKRFTTDTSRLSPSVHARRSALQTGSNTLLVLGAAPLVAMTLFVVAVALSRHPIVGPDPDSFFATIGLAVSYALPLLVFALALAGHAVDQRSPPLALTAGLLLNLCATAGYLLTVRGPAVLGHEQWLRLAQLNAIVTAVYGLAWTTYVWRRWQPMLKVRVTQLLPTQLGIAGGFAAAALLPAIGRLFWSPTNGFPFETVAGVWGWSAIALVYGAIMMLAWVEHRRVGSAFVVTGLFSLGALAAFELHREDVGDWLTFHALQVGQLGAAVLSLVAARLFLTVDRDAEMQPGQQFRAVVRWLNVLLIVICLFALRAVDDNDPHSPWWAVGGLISASALCALLAGVARRRRYLYVAGLLLNVAVSIWWVADGRKWFLPASRGADRLLHFWLVNVIALALPVPLWFGIHQRWMPPRLERAAPWRFPFHRFAAISAGCVLSLVVGVSLLSDFFNEPISPQVSMCWLAWAAVTVALATCLWDRRAPFALAGTYLCGLVAATLLIDQFDLTRDQLLWSVSMVFGAYAIATSYLFSRRGGLAVIGQYVRIPPRGEALSGRIWLVPANLLLALVVVFLGYWAQFAVGEAPWRLSASQAVIAQAFSVGMLARGRGQSQLRWLALWLGVLGAVAFSWSFVAPQSDGALLDRCVLVAVTLAGMAALYGLGLSKLLRHENDWTRAASRQVPALVVLALTSIVGVLLLEVGLYIEHDIAEMSLLAIAAVAAALLVLAAACLVAALVPGRDPLNLSERQRTVYVYATEAMLALLFVHIRLTMPWLFSGVFTRFWPLIIMALAFLGVGLSEWFQRRHQRILATPLERTGVMLPMLPVLGFWLAPAGDVHFSFLMLTVGLLYGGLSVMRRSFGFGLLAALAVNGGLWYLLYDTEGLGLLDHPQLWLIPPALCVLIAAYLNRERLSESQMTTVRYLTSTVIYTSSTADIFLTGVAQAPWLPLVLAGLSILGILAGIATRVRAFLFLGTAFLVLALMTMIWYAAVDLQQTWLWFVTGIVMGILIIAAFATIEKKRDEVLRLVEQLRQWDA